MTGKPAYHDPNDPNPKPVTIDLSRDDERRLYQVAEWYAGILKVNGITPPRDPVAALIDAAESLIAGVQARDRLLREHGIDPADIANWTTLQ